ncbi:MAG: hypothetical protein K0R22_2589, partial [Sporomusa sp.]|nr:hypothetical protein [Sporomusa sp.]
RNQFMVAMVKWLARRIVAPVFEGSRPSSHPKEFKADIYR